MALQAAASASRCSRALLRVAVLTLALVHATAVPETATCGGEVMLGLTGVMVNVQVSANDTAVTLFAEVSHNDWFAVGFSRNGSMAGSTALVLSEEGAVDGSDFGMGMSPYALHAASYAGVQQLSESEALTYGLDIVAWDAAAGDRSANFTVVIDRSALASSELLENPGYLVMASGAGHGNYAIDDHYSLHAALKLRPHWLDSCIANGTIIDTGEIEEMEEECGMLRDEGTCEVCGRCAFLASDDNETDFSQYPEEMGLDLPNQLRVSTHYQVSWEVHAPIPGYNVTDTGERPYIHMLLQAKTLGWVGFGFAGQDKFGMEGTDILWGGITEDGVAVVYDSWSTTVGRPPSDEDFGGVQSAFDVRGSLEHGVVSLEFKRFLNTGDAADTDLTAETEFLCAYAYNSGGTSLDLDSYHLYTRGFVRVQLYSVECEIGEYLSSTNGTCNLCPPGHACPDKSSIEACSPGTYADQPGMVACVSCDNSANVGYSNETGAVECSDCPLNTERTIESSFSHGASAEDCVCKFGYYRLDGARGLTCEPCPEGGFCAGGTQLPRPLPGYWGTSDHPDSFTPCTFLDSGACDLCTNASVDTWFTTLDLDDDEILSLEEVQGVPRLVPALRVAYASSWAISIGDGHLHNVTYRDFLLLVGVDPADEDSYVPYRTNFSDHDDAGHGMVSYCAPGYDGEVCAVCEEGHYRFNSKCFECPAAGGASFGLMLGYAMAVVSVWFCVAKGAHWLESDTFDLLLLFMQCMGIIMAFNLPFYSWISTLAPLFSLAAFNIDLFRPSCLIGWDYHFTSILQLLLPVVVLVVSGVKVLIVKLLTNRGFGGKYLCCNRFLMVPSDMNKYMNANIAIVTSFVFLVYTELVVTSISPFRLIELPDGHSVMRAAPSIEAWTFEYYALQAVPGAVGCLVYVVGVPLASVLYLRKLKKLRLLADDDTLERFRWLYGKYRLEHYYWEIVILLRRLILVVVAIMMDVWSCTQGTVALGFLVGLLCAQFKCQPFRRTQNNVTDTIFITLLIGLTFVGLVSSTAESSEGFAGFYLFFLGSGTAYAFFLLTKDVSGTASRRSASKRLRMPDDVLRLFATALHAAFQTLSCEQLSHLASAIAVSQKSGAPKGQGQSDTNASNGDIPIDKVVEEVSAESSADDFESDAGANDTGAGDSGGSDGVASNGGDVGTHNRQRRRRRVRKCRVKADNAGYVRKDTLLKWAERSLTNKHLERRKSSLHMFPRMGTMQTSFDGVAEERPLLLHDAHAVIQKIIEKVWEDMLKQSRADVNSELGRAMNRYLVSEVDWIVCVCAVGHCV